MREFCGKLCSEWSQNFRAKFFGQLELHFLSTYKRGVPNSFPVQTLKGKNGKLCTFKEPLTLTQ